MINWKRLKIVRYYFLIKYFLFYLFVAKITHYYNFKNNICHPTFQI
jgi:hypothetical protein